MFRPQTIWPNVNCVRQSLPARYRAATRLHPARWRGRCWLPLPPPVGKTADPSLSSWLSVSGCNQPEPPSKNTALNTYAARADEFSFRPQDELSLHSFPDEMELVASEPHIGPRGGHRVDLLGRIIGSRAGERRRADISISVELADGLFLRQTGGNSEWNRGDDQQLK